MDAALAAITHKDIFNSSSNIDYFCSHILARIVKNSYDKNMLIKDMDDF